MQKILNSIECFSIKSVCVLGFSLLMFAVNFILPAASYAAIPPSHANPDVIQPFELTNPAATRSEAYDEVAKLNKDPKALIAAENKEERAEEKLYKEEVKAAKSNDDK